MVKVEMELNHKHSTDCETASSPKKYCKCKCGGALHGVISSLDEFNMPPENTQDVTKDMGGKLLRMANKIAKHKIECRFCHSDVITAKPKAYPHEDGIEDKDGKGWWLFYYCSNCQHLWAWWKLDNMIKDMRKDE